MWLYLDCLSLTSMLEAFMPFAVYFIKSLLSTLIVSQRVLLTMFQQTRSSRPAAKLKTVSGHHPTGGVLEVDLSLHGSAGTRVYRWVMLSSWQRTDRFGDKSQRRDATADRSAPWWWWWWTLIVKEKPIEKSYTKFTVVFDFGFHSSTKGQQVESIWSVKLRASVRR